jgi:hypothetical protein
MFRAIRRKKSENGLKRPTAGSGAGRRAVPVDRGIRGTTDSTYHDRIVYAIDTSIEFSISRETTSERPGLTTIYVSMHSSGSQASPLLSANSIQRVFLATRTCPIAPRLCVPDRLGVRLLTCGEWPLGGREPLGCCF